MAKVSVWITVAILLLYFVPFTSGLYYWASGITETMRLITPFSWALSAKDKGFTGVYSQYDLDCVNWLLNQSDKKLKIACDSNALYLLSGYMELVPDAWAEYGREDRMVTMFGTPELGRFYLFLTEWNKEHQGYIETADVGLRKKWDLTLYSDRIEYKAADIDVPERVITVVVKAQEVYCSGYASVYLCEVE